MNFGLLDHQLRAFFTITHLSIDGTHSYEKSCLLIATGVDVDSGLYPMAFTILESELEDSWWWF